MKKIKLFIIIAVFLSLAAGGARAQNPVNVKPLFLRVLRNHLDSLKTMGLSSKYFSVADTEPFLIKVDSYILGVAVDPGYVKGQGLTQPRNQLWTDIVTTYESKYDGWIIMSMSPDQPNSGATVSFHEAIHAYHLAISSEADADEYGGPENISFDFYNILLSLRRVDNDFLALLERIKKRQPYQEQLNKLIEQIESRKEKMRSYTPQFYECLKNIGGKCDWDGYIKEINETIDKTKKEAEFKDIDITIDYPKEIEVGKEFRIDARCTGGTGKLAYKWTISGGGTSSSPSILAMVHLPTVESFTFQVWDDGRYSKTPKKMEIAVKAYAKLTGSITGPEEVEIGKTVTLKANISGGKAPIIYQWTLHGGKRTTGESFTDVIKGVAGEIKTLTLLVQDSLNPPQSLVIHKCMKVIAPPPASSTVIKPEIIISKVEIIPGKVHPGDTVEVNVHLLLKGFKTTPVPIEAVVWLESSSGGAALSNSGTYLCDRGVLRSLSVKMPTKKDGKPGKIKAVVKVTAEGISSTAYGWAELVKLQKFSLKLTADKTSIKQGGKVNAVASVTGGVPPYTYSWTLDGAACPGCNVPAITTYPKTPGDHNLRVVASDSSKPPNTLEGALSFKVISPLSVKLSAPKLTAKPSEKIEIFSEVTGGIPPYKYQWFLDGKIYAERQKYGVRAWHSKLGSHTVSVTVTDSSKPPEKCEGAISFKVSKSEPLKVSLGADMLTIKEGQTSNIAADVTGGTPPYKYSWSLDGKAHAERTQPTIKFKAGPKPGTREIKVAVTDSGKPELKSEASIKITVEKSKVKSDIFDVEISATKTEVFIGEKIKIAAKTNGGTEPFKYTWYINGKYQPQLDNSGSIYYKTTKEGSSNILVCAIDSSFPPQKADGAITINIKSKGDSTSSASGQNVWDPFIGAWKGWTKIVRSSNKDDVGQTQEVELKIAPYGNTYALYIDREIVGDPTGYKVYRENNTLNITASGVKVSPDGKFRINYDAKVQLTVDGNKITGGEWITLNDENGENSLVLSINLWKK